MELEFIDEDAQARYKERRWHDLQRCLESLKRRDLTTLESVGHNLKGNGSSFGYPELSQLGEKLEIAAKQSDFSKCSSFLQQFEQWLQQQPK